jgi:hypothetical protein
MRSSNTLDDLRKAHKSYTDILVELGVVGVIVMALTSIDVIGNNNSINLVLVIYVAVIGVKGWSTAKCRINHLSEETHKQ